MSRRQRYGLICLAIGIASLGLVWVFHQILPGPKALAQVLMSLGHWQEAVFILAHVAATVVAVPGTVLVVAGGALFGVFWGTLWSVIGATLGAIAAFLVARYGLRDWCRCRTKQLALLEQMDQRLKARDFWYVLAVRFAPVSPFNVVNFLFGLTSVRFSAYALGTGLGIIPGTTAYTWLGAAGLTAWERGNWLPLGLALLALSGLSLTPVLIRHRPNYHKLRLCRLARNRRK